MLALLGRDEAVANFQRLLVATRRVKRVYIYQEFKIRDLKALDRFLVE